MNRPYYPTKAAWAAAKAEELRDQAYAQPYVASSNWRGVRRRSDAMSRLREDARRFERMAERYRAQGL